MWLSRPCWRLNAAHGPKFVWHLWSSDYLRMATHSDSRACFSPLFSSNSQHLRNQSTSICHFVFQFKMTILPVSFQYLFKFNTQLFWVTSPRTPQELPSLKYKMKKDLLDIPIAIVFCCYWLTPDALFFIFFKSSTMYFCFINQDIVYLFCCINIWKWRCLESSSG